MFDNLLINPQTGETLKFFIKKPSHGVLITGQPGAGKLTIARWLAAGLLGTSEEKLATRAHFLHIKKADDKKDISIEQIRLVIRELGLKIPGKETLKRVILIEDAQLMSAPAQNALLKSLEEPSAYSIFILTAPDASDLLPTIASRVTKIAVHPIELAEAEEFFKTGKSAVEAAWTLSRGLPGLLSRLLSAEPTQLATAIETAKKLLAMPAYERCVQLDKISRDKAELELLLDALARIIQALYMNAATKAEASKLQVLTKSMGLILSAQNALAANGSPRLVALHIATNLPI